MFLETQRDAKAHYHKRLALTTINTARARLTIACRIAQWGKPGFFGGSLNEAKNLGLWKIREPQGSHLKKTSMLRKNAYQSTIEVTSITGQTNARVRRARVNRCSILNISDRIGRPNDVQAVKIPSPGYPIESFYSRAQHSDLMQPQPMGWAWQYHTVRIQGRV